MQSSQPEGSLSQTLPETIAAILAEQIIAAHYKAGGRLVESSLVKQFKVSHGPVRDALRILENAGLVIIHPYRGAQVTQLSVREVQEIYQVRAALVGLRARWIAEDEARAGVVTLVQEPISRLTRLAKDPRAEKQYIDTAACINATLTQTLSNRWLRTTLQALTLQTRRYTRLALSVAQRRKKSAQLWNQLLCALKSGDADTAQTLASTISLSTRDAAIVYLQKEPETSCVSSFGISTSRL